MGFWSFIFIKIKSYKTEKVMANGGQNKLHHLKSNKQEKMSVLKININYNTER